MSGYIEHNGKGDYITVVQETDITDFPGGTPEPLKTAKGMIEHGQKALWSIIRKGGDPKGVGTNVIYYSDERHVLGSIRLPWKNKEERQGMCAVVRGIMIDNKVSRYFLQVPSWIGEADDPNKRFGVSMFSADVNGDVAVGGIGEDSDGGWSLMEGLEGHPESFTNLLNPEFKGDGATVEYMNHELELPPGMTGNVSIIIL